MNSYGPLSRFYDTFTGDVPYDDFAGLYEKLLGLSAGDGGLLLDLCCGTGTLSLIFASRGYEVIGVDASPDMLAVATEKTEKGEYPVKPMFLCQEASELDLYGTVSGAFCALDAINYISSADLKELFRRLRLFIEPGGILAFDLHSPEHLRELHGETFVDETEDTLCLWRAFFDEEEAALFYGMDIFTRDGEKWNRFQEEHIEYAHDPAELCRMLEGAGFARCEIIKDGVQCDMGRIFIRAENTAH